MSSASPPKFQTVQPSTTQRLLQISEPRGRRHGEQKDIIFDPISRVDRIEASADPLLELRAAVYLISGRRGRAASAS
jgi:catalase